MESSNVTFISEVYYKDYQLMVYQEENENYFVNIYLKGTTSCLEAFLDLCSEQQAIAKGVDWAIEQSEISNRVNKFYNNDEIPDEAKDFAVFLKKQPTRYARHMIKYLEEVFR